MLFRVDNDDLFRSAMLVCIVKCFVFVESTVSHTQFYDKYQHRNNLLKILRHVWNDSNRANERTNRGVRGCGEVDDAH
ncbi:MAG: hypothetical protein P4M11_04240, partial [Candidatus Pacebacteria bacterium]|nr:hypothetical protein [Candidatus Paceibacterota bacterium]